MNHMSHEKLKGHLEALYKKFNTRKYVHPDPIELIYQYKRVKDREIAALIASSLAYGRVAQILKSVSGVLESMGDSPHDFLMNATPRSLHKTFQGFYHRFATGKHLIDMLLGVKTMVQKHGSMNQCFLSALSPEHENVLPAMTCFCEQLWKGKKIPGHLVPRPEKGSACKRMNLFLRWMVRKDRIDPGGWTGISKSKLIMPLDTHIHKIGLGLNMTRLKQANMRATLEITTKFRELSPHDPTKYDFALSRLGIRKDQDIVSFLNNDE